MDLTPLLYLESTSMGPNFGSSYLTMEIESPLVRLGFPVEILSGLQQVEYLGASPLSVTTQEICT